jgi:hypothetical protein
MPDSSFVDLKRIVRARRRIVLTDTRAFDGCQSVAVVQDHADPAHLLPPLLAGVPRTSICEPRADV